MAPLAEENDNREATVLLRVEEAFARFLEASQTSWVVRFPPLTTMHVSSKFMTYEGVK